MFKFKRRNYKYYAYMKCPTCYSIFALEKGEWISCTNDGTSQKYFKLVGSGRVEIRDGITISKGD